jgi:alkanesulfonate monooxygenase SsuD/methylene tetrahydromethanopterin reductase-like flavin-dependent oxidoreductase (luciferase family)
VQPKPLQRGGIPLWIAGGGEQKTLRTAAKYAQYTNFTPEPEAFKRKSEILAKHCGDVGTDFDAIVRSANFTAVVGDTDGAVEERLRVIRDRLVGHVGEDAADAMIAVTATDAATGTPEQVVEKLKQMRDLGCDYAIVNFPEAAYDRSGIELFERSVIPALS